MRRLPYYLSFLLLILFFSSCQKGETSASSGSSGGGGTPPATTVAEDKVYITTVYNNTINCIKGIRDGDCSQALITFLGISNNVVANQTWIDQMTGALDTAMGFPKISSVDSKFDFPAYRGTYNWNATTKKFVKTTSTTGIYVNFPSAPTVLTNNVNAKMTTYVDGLYQANAQNIYLPTNVKASLSKDGIELVNVDATGIFSSGSFPSPISVVCTLVLKPHTYKFTVTRLNNTKFSVKAELGGDCGSVLDGTVTFSSEDYNNFVLETFLSTVQATYTKADLTVVLNWDAKTYYAISNPTTTNLNNTISCVVNHSGVKIGELKFKDVAGKRRVYIYYKDGTSEDISVYNDPFTAQLRTILRPYFGNEVDNWFL